MANQKRRHVMKVNDKRKRRRKILELFTVTIVSVVVSVLTTLWLH